MCNHDCQSCEKNKQNPSPATARQEHVEFSYSTGKSNAGCDSKKQKPDMAEK